MPQWEGFTPGLWQKEINARDFIPQNYTPYDSDEAFLAPATDRTEKIWKQLTDLFVEEDEAVEVEADLLEGVELGPLGGDIGPRPLSGDERFFERDLERPQRAMQRGDADLEAEPGLQGFQREIMITGDRRTEFGLMAAVERELLDAWRPGRDFAGGFVASDELANPLGADGELATEFGEGEAALIIRQYATTKIQRQRCGHDRNSQRVTIMTAITRKRNRDSEDALIACGSDILIRQKGSRSGSRNVAAIVGSLRIGIHVGATANKN